MSELKGQEKIKKYMDEEHKIGEKFIITEYVNVHGCLSVKYKCADCGYESKLRTWNGMEALTRCPVCYKKEKETALIGQQFGYLTVIKYDSESSERNKKTCWLCSCSCGKDSCLKEIIVRQESLKSGNTKSCGAGNRKKNIKDTIKISYNKMEMNVNLVSIEDVSAKKEDDCKANNSNISKRSKMTVDKRMKRYASNLEIGELGESIVIELESHIQKKVGNNDFIIEQVSKFDDRLGYDIVVKNREGKTIKYIEVKATTGAVSTPFDITNNEINAANQYGEQYFVYRLGGIKKKGNMRNIDYYMITGTKLINEFEFEPQVYKALKKSTVI